MLKFTYIIETSYRIKSKYILLIHFIKENYTFVQIQYKNSLYKRLFVK